MGAFLYIYDNKRNDDPRYVTRGDQQILINLQIVTIWNVIITTANFIGNKLVVQSYFDLITHKLQIYNFNIDLYKKWRTQLNIIYTDIKTYTIT